MSTEYTVSDDGVITITKGGQFIIQYNGKIIDITPENILPVIWNGDDWVLDEDDPPEVCDFDGAMSIV